MGVRADVAAFLRDISSLSSRSQPGASLEQTHIFVLAHILRRPIIVYGVKYYKSFRGETLGYTRFQGEAAGEPKGAFRSKEPSRPGDPLWRRLPAVPSPRRCHVTS